MKMKKAIVARGYIPELARMGSDRPRFAQFITACFACQSVEQVYFAVDPKRDVGDTVAFLSALPVPAGKKLSVIPVKTPGDATSSRSMPSSAKRRPMATRRCSR